MVQQKWYKCMSILVANTKIIVIKHIKNKIPREHKRAYGFPTPVFGSITRSFRCHRHNPKQSNLNLRSIVSFSVMFLARECVLSNYIHGLNGLNHYSGTGAMWRNYLKLLRTFFPASVAGDQLNFLSHIFLRWSFRDNDLLWWYASAVKIPSRCVQPNRVKYLKKF